MSSLQLTPAQRRSVTLQYQSRLRRIRSLERRRFRYIRYFDERVNTFNARHGFPLFPIAHPCETYAETAEAIHEFIFQYNQCVIDTQRLPLQEPRRWDTCLPMLTAFFVLYRSTIVVHQRTIVYAYAEEMDILSQAKYIPAAHS
ncbi:hypothetical protein SISNIDRAFT_471711 [Sistotremastrum niveocremeum HHB9708]|uniref:Uncharacterized protein n=1 Tax=Sistotremastrum niveocremeum HHB9708 TaxID=1314777 RepID=A0A164MAS7_9AGAM|nr:hypothetical protein SISNIDRAFT_471711 [Sistotremastrum niveocremeum HHB9708]